MKFINLKKWSWVLCLVLLAAPAWGQGKTLVLSSDLDENGWKAIIKDFPEEASKDVFGGKTVFWGSLVSNSLYPDGPSGNTVTVLGVPSTFVSMDFVAGGWSSHDSTTAAEVTGNTVEIKGGQIKSAVLGGVSEIKSVKNNTVKISGGIVGSDDRAVDDYGYKTHPGQVYGGYVTSDDGDASDSNNANATENKVEISGGIIHGPVMGGFVQGPLESLYFITTAGSGDVVSNEVKITGGTLAHSIYGGKAGSGDAEYNKVSISGSLGVAGKWTSMDAIIGGHSWAGNVTGNRVKIAAPLTLSDDSFIIGGQADNPTEGASTGTASYNIVDIQASVDAREIIGGWTEEGSATENRVRLWAKDGKTIKVGPGAAASLDIKAGQGGTSGTSTGNIVEIYGNVTFEPGKVNLYGDKLILAKSTATTLEVGKLEFSSFDIAAGGYSTGGIVLSADKAALKEGTEIKVYSFGLTADTGVLYLISSDTALTGSVKHTAGDTGKCLIWGTNTGGNVIRLQVTSDDDKHWLAVSSDLTVVASVDDIAFGDVIVNTSAAPKDITIISHDFTTTSLTYTVRKVGQFFSVTDNKVELNLNSDLVRTEPYKGKIFVDFSNGATAVADVTVTIKPTPDNPDPGPAPSPTPPGPDPDPAPTPDDPVVELPVADAVVAGDTATVTVEITPAEISAAIDEAIQKTDGTTDVPTVSIPVKVESPAAADAEIKEVEVDIPLETLEAIVAKVEESAVEDVALKITAIDTTSKLNVGEITLNTAALKELITQVKAAGETATIQLVITKSEAKLEDEEKLTPEQVTALNELDDDRVFDVSLLVGNTPVTDFGTGKLTVALPYKAAMPDENKADVNVYHIPATGSKVLMSDTDRSKDGKIIFTTSHLSVYALFYEPKVDPTPAPGPEPAPDDGGSGGGCDAGFGAAAGLLLATAYLASLAARKGGKR